MRPPVSLFALSVLLCGTLQAQEPLAAQRVTKSGFTKFFLQYSPDGSHLTYTRHHENRRAANKVLMGLRIVKADGTGDRPLLPEFESAVQIQEHGAWAPDGKRLLVTGGGNDTGNSAKDIFVCDVSPDFKASNLRKVIPGPSVNIGEQATWSPDGREFCVVTVDHTLWIFSADGKSKRSLIRSAGNYCFQPGWSPDGEWIAFSSDRDGNAEIYKIRDDGSELTRLTDTPGVDCRPAWSPDGAWLAFTSNRDGNNDLWLMRPDGLGPRNLTQNPAHDDHAAWSPDGKSLAFISMRDGGFDIYRAPVDVTIGPRPAPRKREAAPGDLVLRYTFDGDSGKRARDRAGRYGLELDGAVLAKVDGRECLEFDGKSAFASAANPTAVQLSGPLTVALWIRPAPSTGNGYVISKHGWNLYLGADSLPRFETRDAKDAAWDTLTGNDKVPPEQWTHVALVFEPAKKRLAIYVNGKLSVERARTDGALGSITGYPLELGRYNAGKSQYFTGALDDLQLWGKALSDGEILKLSAP